MKKSIEQYPNKRNVMNKQRIMIGMQNLKMNLGKWESIQIIVRFVKSKKNSGLSTLKYSLSPIMMSIPRDTCESENVWF